MPFYDLHHVTKMTAEEIAPDTDLVPIWHPTGGNNAMRSMTLGQLMGGMEGGTPSGGVSQADFDELKANVIADLNNLRDAIMYTQASLDNDAGVATDTFAANGTPPPLLTV